MLYSPISRSYSDFTGCSTKVFQSKITHFLDPTLHLLVLPLFFHIEQFVSLFFSFNYDLYIFSWAQALYFLKHPSCCICLFSDDDTEALHFGKFTAENVLFSSGHHIGDLQDLFLPLLLRLAWLSDVSCISLL